jgi:tetratricopeptide (TPR) repeat protein
VDDSAAPTLTVEAARKRLGLGKDDQLADYLPHWKEVEMRLAGLAVEARDPAAKASFEKDLAELREVLRVVCEDPKLKLELALGLKPGPEPESESESESAAELEPKQNRQQNRNRKRKQNSGGKGVLAWLLVLAFLGGAGYWGYQQWLGNGIGERQNVVNLRETEDRFEEALEKRRWDDAEDLVELLEAEGAEKAKVKDALSRVKRGRVEERGQQIAFLVSNAQSALEAGQLTEAEKYTAEVENLQPGHPKVPEFRLTIRQSKMRVRSLLMAQEIEKALENEDWRAAGNQLEALVKGNAGHPRIPEFRKKLEAAEAEMKARRVQADELIAKARELDQGTYSAEALKLVEEAMRLDPSEANRELFKRMSSYGKVVKVPGDFPTITAALKVAKENDRVFVAKGTYQESLVVPAGVELVGESRGDTIIECPAKIGSVIMIGAGDGEARISSLTLRHSGLVNDDERFAILALDGGKIEISDVVVARASGHGIAILNGGVARLNLCKVTDCGWDGIAVTGEESSVILEKVTSEKNLHHGVDFWDGASGRVTESSFLENGRAGLLAISPSLPISIEKTKSEKNREVGFLFSNAVGVSLTDCDVHENLLGGMVFDGESMGIQLKNNRVTKNGEAGIVFERGVEVANDSGNMVKDNFGKQIWKDAVFPNLAEEDTVSPPPPAPPLHGAGANKGPE